MEYTPEHIAYLLYRRQQGLLTAAEEQSLKDWMAGTDHYRNYAAQWEAEDAWRALLARDEQDRDQAVKQRVRQVIDSAIQAPSVHAVHRVHFLRTAWLRFAAMLLLLAGVATWFYIQNRVHVKPPQLALTDIHPGANKAILTLADGSTILLDSAAGGSLAQQGNTRIIKLQNGSLAYNAGTAPVELMFNTVSTPRGGQYQIVLPDGSRVWLNAESAVKFPAAFNSSNRTVELQGEAYFEVVADKARPFNVLVNGTTIHVLGTSFNINGYADEAALVTTLLDGAVSVNMNDHSQLLAPGQQAQATKQGSVVLNPKADLEAVMAWKNGLFNFKDKKLSEVMRQLARWYDIEVVYEKGIPDIEFGGKMSRNVKLADLLEGLKGVGVSFRIEERRRLIVTP